MSEKLVRDAIVLFKPFVFVGVLLSVSVPAFADDKQEAAIKRDRERIEGVWKVVSILAEGKETKEEQLGQMKVTNGKDGSWLLQQGDKVIAKGDSTINPTQSPKTIDFRATINESKVQSFAGIYELGKTKRRLCFALDGGARPTKFASPVGSKQVVVTFERIKTQ